VAVDGHSDAAATVAVARATTPRRNGLRMRTNLGSASTGPNPVSEGYPVRPVTAPVIAR
jgi:hypothetical protein